jgi:methylmalonyl-CoA mutase
VAGFLKKDYTHYFYPMEKLFTGFDPANAAAWKARLEKDLKGVTFEQLSVTDRNGIVIHPFYTAEDITATKAPVTTQPDWSICTKLVVTNAKAANTQALNDLNHGASGLCFVIEEIVDPAVLLQDIELPFIYSSFQLTNKTLSFEAALIDYCDTKGWNTATMDCFICYDTIADYLKTGDRDGDSFIPGHAPQQICVDATQLQNAGAASTYELACTLSQLNEYLHLHEEKDALDAVKKLHISLSTDTSFFEQIAKLRALRTLVPLVLNEYNISPVLHLHIETANTYRSSFDSYSNLLRDTIAGMAAVIGGCNSLYIHPFDETLREPTDFSMRMSRNQQLIFKEESYLNKVADAAAGSYYLETLTEQIAEQAWVLFKEIETEGGLLASFDKDIIQKKINEQAAQLVQEYKDGKRVLIGVNKFVDAKDQPKPSILKQATGKGLKPLFLAEEII